jgi:hypothetical protein
MILKVLDPGNLIVLQMIKELELKIIIVVYIQNIQDNKIRWIQEINKVLWIIKYSNKMMKLTVTKMRVRELDMDYLLNLIMLDFNHINMVIKMLILVISNK